MKSQQLPLLAAFGLFVVAGSSCNQSGDRAARGSGDLSHLLKERGDALAELAALCPTEGDRAARLGRRPYVQKLTDRSVDVLWTADAGLREGNIVLTEPFGPEIARITAAPDLSAPRPAGPVVARGIEAPRTQWIASLVGLRPETAYCYEVRSEEGLLARGGFRTAPPPGSPRPVRFAVVGDSGDGGADQRAVLAQLKTLPFDLFLLTGDIAYDSGTRRQFEEHFFRIYADLLTFLPAFPASGNHEYETEDAAPFREAFALPENGGPEGRERWYSFDYGNVHFVALDSERVGPEQAAWLDADLTNTQLPWKIVYFHRPPFSSGDHGGSEAVKTHFVPLFAKHQVPLVLTGHDHHYERTHPQDGVTYVVTGGGGRYTRPVGQSPFTRFAESVYHLVYVTVEGNELTLHAIDGVGREFDSLLVRR
jgi:hypothetical protein